MKGGKGNWHDHVPIGMGGGMAPVNTQQNSNAPSGTNIALLFNKPLPSLKAADIKKILAPVLDFEKETATEITSRNFLSRSRKRSRPIRRSKAWIATRFCSPWEGRATRNAM